MKIRLFALLSLVCSFLLVSNVSAVSYTVSVDPTGNYFDVGNNLRCHYFVGSNGYTSSSSQNGDCTFPQLSNGASPGRIQDVYLANPISVKQGNYYSFFIWYGNTSLDYSDVQWTITANSSDFIVTQFETVTQSRMLDECRVWTTSGNTQTCSSLTSFQYPNSHFTVVTLMATRTGSATLRLGSATGSPATFMLIPYGAVFGMSTVFEFQPSTFTDLVESNQSIDDTLKENQQQDKQDRDDMQSTVDGSSSEADDAQASVDDARTNLIGAAVNLVEAVSNASPTNCRVAADIGSMDLGELDFCSGKPAAFDPIISTCVLLVCAPLGWIWGKHILSDMLSLLESFNGYPMGEFD